VRITRIVAPALVLAALAAPARATIFVGMSERILARMANEIVIGTVERTQSIARDDGAINTLVTVQVEQTIKGKRRDHVVLRQTGGRIGDRILWLAGSPRFAVGDHQLLFLSGRGDGSVRTTALGMGQFNLSPHSRTGEMMAERALEGAVVG